MAPKERTDKRSATGSATTGTDLLGIQIYKIPNIVIIMYDVQWGILDRFERNYQPM